MLEIKDLYLSIDNKQILKNINFSIGNEIITIIGPSGCGKSSLLKSIIGINKADGDVILNGNIMNNIPIEKRKIAIVFQDFILFPHLSVYDNLMIVNNNKEKVNQILNRFMIEYIKDKKPSTLSGGEIQRVSIARALLTEPDLLLLDEPFSNVDNITKTNIERDIKKILKDSNIPTIMVTHNKNDAFFMSDKIIVMNEGKIIQYDTIQNIYEFPVDVFTSKLMGECNYINGKLVRPEWLNVYPSENGYKVISSTYYGSYSRLVISDGNIFNTLIVYDYSKKIKINDTVSIKPLQAHEFK